MSGSSAACALIAVAPLFGCASHATDADPRARPPIAGQAAKGITPEWALVLIDVQNDDYSGRRWLLHGIKKDPNLRRSETPRQFRASPDSSQEDRVPTGLRRVWRRRPARSLP